jgi:hypothetical protein
LARPALVDHETVVQLIGNTRTQTGLRVRARLDTHSYPTGIHIPDAVLAAVELEREDFTVSGITRYCRPEICNLINLFMIGS